MSVEIVCPVCGYVYDGDKIQDMVSLFGTTENSPYVSVCPCCNVRLEIHECVWRDYDIEILGGGP